MARVGKGKKSKAIEMPEIAEPKKTGRPVKFNTPEEMQECIDRYFDSCFEEVWEPIVIDKQVTWTQRLDPHGMPIVEQKRPFTISGVSLACGLSRQGLLEYERKALFSDTVKMAKARCEGYAEEQLFTNKQTAGVIFNMVNNYGWNNKQEKVVYVDPKSLTDEQLKELITNGH